MPLVEHSLVGPYMQLPAAGSACIALTGHVLDKGYTMMDGVIGNCR